VLKSSHTLWGLGKGITSRAGPDMSGARCKTKKWGLYINTIVMFSDISVSNYILNIIISKFSIKYEYITQTLNELRHENYKQKHLKQEE
jgi:hypothetical protein